MGPRRPFPARATALGASARWVACALAAAPAVGMAAEPRPIVIEVIRTEEAQIPVAPGGKAVYSIKTRGRFEVPLRKNPFTGRVGPAACAGYEVALGELKDRSPFCIRLYYQGGEVIEARGRHGRNDMVFEPSPSKPVGQSTWATADDGGIFSRDDGLAEIRVHTDGVGAGSAGTEEALFTCIVQEPEKTLSYAELRNLHQLGKTWTSTALDPSVKGYCTGTITVEVRAAGPTEEPKLALDGCTDLVPGKTARVTARAEPGGGSFRWWTEPSRVVAVEGTGGGVTLRGQAPGRTTLHVEYTAPGGKKVEASRPASCLKLVSVNGGAPLPEVVQWEDEGSFDPSWLRKVPLEVEPAGGGDLVRFSVADPSVLGTTTEARSLVVQGIRDGETTIQAQSPCGEKLGAAMAVSVARCHKDYVARLRRELDQLKKESDEISKKLAQVLDNPRFRKAADEIAWDTGMLAFETAKAIASAGGAGAAGTKLEGGAEALAGLLEAADGVLKALQGQEAEFALDRALQKAKAKTAAAIKDLFSAVEAANKFGDDLGRLIETADAVAQIEEWRERNTRLFKEVVEKLNRCKGERGQEPGKGTKPEVPGGPKPPKGQKPSEPEGGPEPGGAGEAEGGTKPPGAEAPPPPPPQPPRTPPPQRPGLPLPPEEKERVQKLLVDRGCGGKGPSIELRDAKSAAAGLRGLEKAMTGFRDGPLTRFRGALGRLEGAIQQAESTARAPEAQRRQALGFMVPELKGFATEASSFGKAGDAFLGVVGGCDRSLPPVIEAVRADAKAPR